MQKILKDIKITDLALLVKSTLIISDIHIGYEEALNKEGILIPRFQFKDILKQLNHIFEKLKKIKKIIINGDLKHEFGSISETEWRHTLRLIDYLEKKCKNIVIVKGNHDTIIGPLAKKRALAIKEYEKINDILIIHGDVLNNNIKKMLKKIKTIIIGHEHPAISLRDGSRTEKYKCFLKGKWKKYELIVQPSFSPVIEGTDVLKEELMSPFLQHDIGDFDVFIVGDKVYDFGKVKRLRSVQFLQ